MATYHKSIALHDAHIKGLLNGSKKQHRVPIKAKKNGTIIGKGNDDSSAAEKVVIKSYGRYSHTVEHIYQIPCHFKSGQIISVKEQWKFKSILNDSNEECIEITYLADNSTKQFKISDLPENWCPPSLLANNKIVNAVLMPEFLTRLKIRINSIRVSKLGDITDEQARLEGVSKIPFSDYFKNYLTSFKNISEIEKNLTARESYFTLWQSSRSSPILNLDSFVWVLDIEVI